MSQYTPFGDVKNFKELNRPITKREYQKALDATSGLDEDRLFIQELNSSSLNYIPKWDY